MASPISHCATISMFGSSFARSIIVFPMRPAAPTSNTRTLAFIRGNPQAVHSLCKRLAAHQSSIAAGDRDAVGSAVLSGFRDACENVVICALRTAHTTALIRLSWENLSVSLESLERFA